MFSQADCFIDKYKNIIKHNFGIVDKNGEVKSSNDENGLNFEGLLLNNYENSLFQIDNTTFKKIITNKGMQGFLYIEANNESAIELLEVLSITLVEMLTKSKKNTLLFEDLILNMIEEELPTNYIKEECQKFAIEYKKRRIVFVFKVEQDVNNTGIEVIKSLFPDKTNDIVVMHQNSIIVLIKKLKQKDDVTDFYKIAKIAIDTLNGELMLNANVGIGMPVNDFYEIKESYKQAIEALYTGMAFENEKRYHFFGRLGLGRLINCIDIDKLKLFLSEISENELDTNFDDQTLLIAQKLFENNLNISEASRKSYIHRNTFMYRLEKLEKMTGLDLRKFDHAVIFKMAMLIKIYIERCEKSDDKA